MTTQMRRRRLSALPEADDHSSSDAANDIKYFSDGDIVEGTVAGSNRPRQGPLDIAVWNEEVILLLRV